MSNDQPDRIALGQQIAIDLLAQLESDTDIAEQCILYDLDGWMKDSAQNNVVLTHLDDLIADGNRDTLAGFCSVLSDYIATCCDGVVPDAVFYNAKGSPDGSRRFLAFLMRSPLRSLWVPRLAG
jgi:hypothetical protein